MLFFFRKPKIVVDCYTPYQSVYELFKIRKSSVYYPEEIKRIPATSTKVLEGLGVEHTYSTIKKCEGIKDLYRNGAIIPMWSEVISQPKNAAAGQCVTAVISQPYSWQQHPTSQFPGLFEDYMHVKFSGVWHIREKTGVNFVWQGAYYNQMEHFDHYTIPPAIINYKHQSQTQLNILIKKTSEDFTIKAGTPMVQLIPLTEKNVDYKCHLVSMQEWMMQPINAIPEDFNVVTYNRYRKFLAFKKQSEELDKKEKGKCPFGFGK